MLALELSMWRTRSALRLWCLVLGASENRRERRCLRRERVPSAGQAVFCFKRNEGSLVLKRTR